MGTDNSRLLMLKDEVGRIENNHKSAISVTLVVTEMCNLACKYCYQTGKNTKAAMPFVIAKKAIDFIIDRYTEKKSLRLDFIGGEPFLEIDLIEKVCDYLKVKLYRMQHPWFENYQLDITTNGLLYHTEKVQKFIAKNHDHLNITISIDGVREKHDLQRVYANGRGSYEEVIKNVPLWLKQFPYATTKMTIGSTDLKFTKDSIIHLWNLGMKEVPGSLVNEDCWKKGDGKIFEEQLMELADYIIDNKLWDKVSCSFFDDSIGYPLTEQRKRHNSCASGDDMIAIDHKGDIYPCLRFMEFCLSKAKPIVVGNIFDGINEELLRPFIALTAGAQSDEKCLECEVATGCGWCQGNNYDFSETGSIFERTTFICELHKARCRANNYYWARLENEAGIEKKRKLPKKKFMYFLMENDAVPHCTYRNTFLNNEVLSVEDFKKGIAFCIENFYVPVIIHGKEKLGEEYLKVIKNLEVIHICAPKLSNYYKRQITVFDNEVIETENLMNTILIINRENISKIPEMVLKLWQKSNRINLILEDIDKYANKDLLAYEGAISNIGDILFEAISHKQFREINVLTDILMLGKMQNCNAGVNSITLAPDGELYICPAFYYMKDKQVKGNVVEGFSIMGSKMLKIENAPICSECDAYHCRRCVYQNKLGTREINTPTSMQCRISHIEREGSLKLQNRLKELDFKLSLKGNVLEELDYTDPIEKVLKLKLIN